MSSRKTSTKPCCVAIFQPCFSHYRRTLFTRLCSQSPPLPQYHLFYGREINENSLKTLSAEDFLPPDSALANRFHPIRNMFFGRKRCWQIGPIRIALGNKFDTLIFEGNANILSTWVATVLARLRGKRVLFWSHGFLLNETGLKGWLRSRFYKLANALLLYSIGSRENCLRKGFPSNCLYVVLNSLNHEAHVRIRQSLTENDRTEIRKRLFRFSALPTILWLGRLTPEKQLNILLDAVHHLHGHGQKTNVLLVGDGSARMILTKQVQELGLMDFVRFHGACYDEEELAMLIHGTDLFVGPGEVGLACIHAMTFGTPVVTHDRSDKCHQGPEVEAVIPGRTGDFYRHGDLDDLVHVIQRWFAKTKTCPTIRETCQQLVDNHFTPDYQISIFNAAVKNTPVEDTLPKFTGNLAAERLPGRKEAA